MNLPETTLTADLPDITGLCTPRSIEVEGLQRKEKIDIRKP
jgi:hypothetical protein